MPTARLTDTASGHEIWAKRYERTGEDSLDIQDQLSNSIDYDVFEPLMAAESQRLKDIPDEELDAWGLCARSRMPIVDRSSRDRVRTLLEMAVQRDPDFAFAHSLYAFVLTFMIFNQFVRDVGQAKKDCIEHADIALRLAPGNVVIVNHASVAHRICGDLDHALHLAQRAAEMQGRPGEPLASALLVNLRMEEALEVGRNHPEIVVNNTMVVAALAQGLKDEALEWARGGTTEFPNSFLNWMYLAAAQASLGQLEPAERAVTRAKEIIPTLTLDLFEKGNRIAYRNKDELVDPVMEGLRKLDME